MQIPFPVELDARRKIGIEQFERSVADLEARREPDALMPSFLMWPRSGRVSYRLEHDLLEALLLSEVPADVAFVLPHECFWVDLEGQTDFRLQGEPLVGFFVRPAAHGDDWMGVASTRLLADGSANTLWFLMVNDKNGDRTLGDDEKRIARQLRHIAAMATLYLMDPAHEEALATLHGNSLWERRLKKAGTKHPRQALSVASIHARRPSSRAATSRGAHFNARSAASRAAPTSASACSAATASASSAPRA